MTARDAIKSALNSSANMLKMYLSDLSDADLVVRPVPNANHIAWQLGHLIGAEVWMTGCTGVAPVQLPAGFTEKHSKEVAGAEPPKGYLTKAEYLALYEKARAATLAALEKCSDADLDKPNTGPMEKYAPTVGALFLLVANHDMMHAGQFTVLRRKLGKPILF